MFFYKEVHSEHSCIKKFIPMTILYKEVYSEHYLIKKTEDFCSAAFDYLIVKQNIAFLLVF